MALFLTGCILIPVPVPNGEIVEGTEVPAAYRDFFRPGETTKTDTLALLGQPNIIWSDENIYVYRWVQVKGVLLWAISGGYQADFGAKDLTVEYVLLMDFDANDRLVASETVRILFGKQLGKVLLDWRDEQRSGNSQATNHEINNLPRD